MDQGRYVDERYCSTVSCLAVPGMGTGATVFYVLCVVCSYLPAWAWYWKLRLCIWFRWLTFNTFHLSDSSWSLEQETDTVKARWMLLKNNLTRGQSPYSSRDLRWKEFQRLAKKYKGKLLLDKGSWQSPSVMVHEKFTAFIYKARLNTTSGSIWLYMSGGEQGGRWELKQAHKTKEII